MHLAAIQTCIRGATIVVVGRIGVVVDCFRAAKSVANHHFAVTRLLLRWASWVFLTQKLLLARITNASPLRALIFDDTRAVRMLRTLHAVTLAVTHARFARNAQGTFGSILYSTESIDAFLADANQASFRAFGIRFAGDSAACALAAGAPCCCACLGRRTSFREDIGAIGVHDPAAIGEGEQARTNESISPNHQKSPFSVASPPPGKPMTFTRMVIVLSLGRLGAVTTSTTPVVSKTPPTMKPAVLAFA